MRNELGGNESTLATGNLSKRTMDSSTVDKQNTCSNIDDVHKFGNFATTPSTSTPAQLPFWDQAQEDSNTQDWANFSAASFSVKVKESNVDETLKEQFGRTLAIAFPLIESISCGPNSLSPYSSLETLSCALQDDDAEFAVEKENPVKCFRHMQRSLWNSVKYVEEAEALKFKWIKSKLYEPYLKVIGMDLQLTRAPKYAVPAFAAQLSMSSLIPEKCSVVTPTPVNDTEQAANGPCHQQQAQEVDQAAPSGVITPAMLDIFLSPSINSDPLPGRPALEEDLEQFGLATKTSTLNGHVQSKQSIEPLAVLPVLPPPPVGKLVRCKANQK